MKFFQKISSYINIREKLNKLTKILPLIALGFFPSLSFAANLFEPTSGDVSVKVIGSIFGGLLEGGGSDPMLNAIKMFNGGVLIVGGILAAYTILAGTLGTAHDGEMLGKKFSSVWIPIRYSVGTALVLPVVGGGYCVMQAIVVWLVVQGIGLADQVWITFMSNPGTTANTMTETTSRQQVIDVAQSAFQSSVCYRSYDKVINDAQNDTGAGSVARALGWFDSYKYSMRKTDYGYVYGDEKSLIRNYGCGIVKYPVTKQLAGDATGANVNNSGTYQGRLGTFDNIFRPIPITPILEAQKAQTDILIQAMDGLAAQAVAQAVNMTQAQAEQLYQQMQKAADTYIANMKTVSTSTFQGDSGFKQIQEASKVQGWMLAGAWFTRIIQMNESIHSALNSTPTANAYRPQIFDQWMARDAAKFLDATDLVLNRIGSANKAAALPNSGTDKATSDSNNKGEKIDGKGTFAKFQEWFTEGLTGVDLYELKNDSRHPLIIVAAIGNRLETIAVTLMAVTTAGAAGLAIAAFGGLSSGIITAALTVLGWFIAVPINVLIGSAMMLKYFIPNLPFLIWIGCIIGWTLLVVEAVIAAPLWAIMHLHPNGDDLTGRGGNGYMLVLSLLLRPVLMVFGLIAAIVISSVIGEFINKTFFEVFANNTTLSGTSALFSMVAGTILYLVIMFTFVRKTFGIMHQLPDQLLRWIGGGGSELGQFAGEFNAAGEKAQGMGAMIGGHVAGTLGKSTSALGQKGAKAGLEAHGKAGKAEGLDSGLSARAANLLGSMTGNGMQKGEDGKYRNAAGQQAFSQAQKEQSDSQIDAEVGAGTSKVRDELTSSSFGKDMPSGSAQNNPETFSASFNESARQSNLIGGTEARDDYITRMREAQESKYSSYGGDATLAAKSIGQSVLQDQIAMRSYGITGNQNNAGIQSFAQVMGDKGGSLNGRNAGAALNLANRMSKTVGPSAVNNIMEQAVSKYGNDKDAIKSYVNNEYNALKAQSLNDNFNSGSSLDDEKPNSK